MSQLELLWDYQQTDIKAEAVAKEIKRSPARQKLVKYRDYLLEQQNTIKRIEEEILTMQDRLEVLEDAVKLVEDQLNSLQKKMETSEPQDAEQTERYLSDAQRMMSNLSEYEAEIKRIKKDSADRDRLQYDVKVRAARAKSEFDKLKASYDEEYKRKNEELNALKNARSVTGRLFTEAECASHHCQIGNLQLVLDTIENWIERVSNGKESDS